MSPELTAIFGVVGWVLVLLSVVSLVVTVKRQDRLLARAYLHLLGRGAPQDSDIEEYLTLLDDLLPAIPGRYLDESE